MKSLDELIAYHTQREAEYRDEIDRAASFPDEAFSKRCSRQWAEAREVARDTISWLSTIKERLP